MKSTDKKILIRGIILTAILLLVFVGLNYISRISILNERYEIINNIDYLPKDSIDIMIVGNSHAQEGINASLLSDMLDAKVYNFSFSQQQIATAYYFIKKNLKKQSPDIVMLEAYTLVQQVQEGQEFIPLSPAKIKYYNMIEKEGDFISCFFPIASNHNFWAKENPFAPMIENITSGKDDVEPFFSARIMSDIAVIKHDSFNSQDKVKEMFDYRLDHLLEIKKLCEKNNTQLMIFMLPLYQTLVERIDYDGLYYEKIKAFCDENEILYYDYNKQSDTDWTHKYFREQDYTQNTHLNTYGQTIASMELAEYIAFTSDSYQLSNYEDVTMNIIDFLNTIDTSSNILIIDDCPKKLNTEINSNVVDYLQNINIELKTKETISDNINENDEPEIYYISESTVIDDYILPSTLDYSQDAVGIYELDSSGNVIKHAVIRWDEFDTVILK